MKRTSLLLFACLSMSFAYSQEQWTLQRCINHALENNLTIKQAKLSLALSSSDLTQSRLSALPSVNGTASQNYNFGRSVDPLTNQFVNERIESANYGINASIVLFAGFQRINTIRQNRYQLLANKSNVAKISNDVTLNVVTLYLQVLYTKELVKVNEAQLATSKDQLARAQKNEAVGAITKGDVLTIKAQTAQEELNVANASNQYALAYLNLKQVLDLSADDAFDIVAPQSFTISPIANKDAGELYRMALQTQPDITKVDYELEAAQKSVWVAKGSLSPRLTLGANIGTGYSSGRQRLVPGSTPTFAGFQTIGATETTQENVLQPVFIPQIEKTPFRTQIDENLSQSIGFSLQIPIFNGWQTQSGIKRAKINLQNAQVTSQLVRNNLNKTITQALADASAAEQRFTATQKNVESLQEAFSYTEQKYAVGLLNSLDYSIAKNNLIRAQTDLLQAKYDFIFKNKVIDFYLGNPLIVE